MFLFCSPGGVVASSEKGPPMRWRSHLYPAVIGQNLDVARLSELSETSADEADETGYLAGNQMYQDLRGYGWLDVTHTLEVERRLILKRRGLMMSASTASTLLMVSGASTSALLLRRSRCPLSAPYLLEAATQAASGATTKAHIPMSPSFSEKRPRNLLSRFLGQRVSDCEATRAA
jgi:hypothetical protein